MAEIRYSKIGDLHTSFTKDGSRVVRMGQKSTGRYAPIVKMGSHCVQLVPPGRGRSGWQSAEVYRVRISPDLKARWQKQPESYYVIALSDKAVDDYVKRRYGNIAARNRGLASYVLSLAMQKISTRPPVSGSVGDRAKRIADEWVDISVAGGDEDCTVKIKDNLTYAVDAVKGGYDGVETALKAAANRINGMIRRRIGKDLDNSWRTPFPEVKR